MDVIQEGLKAVSCKLLKLPCETKYLFMNNFVRRSEHHVNVPVGLRRGARKGEGNVVVDQGHHDQQDEGQEQYAQRGLDDTGHELPHGD